MAIEHYVSIAMSAFGIIVGVMISFMMTYWIMKIVFNAIVRPRPALENEEDTIEFEDMK
jgi:hypothetical protein